MKTEPKLLTLATALLSLASIMSWLAIVWANDISTEAKSPAKLTNRVESMSVSNLLNPVSLPATNAQSSTKSNDPIPLIKFEDVPLGAGLEALAWQAGTNIIVRPDLFQGGSSHANRLHPEPVLSFSWENLTIAEAFNRLLKMHGLVAAENPATSVTVIMKFGQTLHAVDSALLGVDTNGIIPLVKTEKTPLDDFLRNLAKQADIKLLIHGPPSQQHFIFFRTMPTIPTVSVCWTNITAKQAIAALCENYNLAIQPTPTNVLIQISHPVKQLP